MTLFSREKVKSSFRNCCSIAVAFMIGYWVYKYKVEDRDIGVVDSLLLNDAMDVDIPVASLCFKDPFIDEKLTEASQDIWSKISRDDYLEYLKGNIFEDKYEPVNYKNVSLDLRNYFLSVEEQWQNSSSMEKSSLKVEHKEVFSGFHYGSFIKCFVLQYDVDTNRHIKAVKLYYDLQKLVDDWRDFGYGSVIGKFFLKVHYPGQFFLGDDPLTASFYDTSSSLVVWIKDLEILQRRNTNKKKCSEHTNSYDAMIMEKYLSSVECKVPYLSNDTSFSMCNGTEKMKESKLTYRVPEILQIPVACKRISRMRISTQSGKKYGTKQWYFKLNYPKEVKTITQSKEVDFHALIGNIGGYLGLFLGK